MGKTKFQVVLENVDLSSTQAKAIQKDINAVVAKHLLTAKKPAAKAAAAPSAGPVYGYMIPKEWMGYWIKNMGTLDKLKLQKEFKLLKPQQI